MILPIEVTKQPPINAAVRETLKELSPAVRLIRYDIGEDWTGQSAIFFRILLSDDASKPDNLRQIVPRIVSSLSDRLELAEFGVFPHFNFRSESEQAKHQDPAWN